MCVCVQRGGGSVLFLLPSLVLSESNALVAPLSSGGGGESTAARSSNQRAGRLQRTSSPFRGRTSSTQRY